MQNNFFSSKIGAILAAAGSAVGLGNIWRFPTETGANGGAAFILIYIFFMLFLGVPVMVTEFVIGRHGQGGVSQSFHAMSGGRKGWRLMGLLPVVAGFLVLSYYSVVAGWTLYYASEAAVSGFSGKVASQYAADFAAFASDPIRPAIWMGAIVALTCGIVAMGVQRGIERAAKMLMPALFVFIVILVGSSLTLPGAVRGLTFLLRPDFSKVTGETVLSAMAQAFFSLSVGICCLCTYASYFRKDVNLMEDGIVIGFIDTFVALMAGLIIFPAVYSVPGLQPDAGPSLVFITLPNVFQQVFSGVPWLAYTFSLLFYLLLVVAAITSSISMLEMSVAYFHDEWHASRPLTAIAVSLVCLVLGTFCSLSFGVWSHVTLWGMGFFDLFDFLVAKILMPIGSLLMCHFVGWVADEHVVRDELTNGGTLRLSKLYIVWRFIIRYAAPIGILCIFVSGLLQ